MLRERKRLLLSLQECAQKEDVSTGRKMHCLFLLQDLSSSGVLDDYLLRLYAFHGTLLEANLLFCQSSNHSVYTWYAIISAHVMHCEDRLSLTLYQDMLESDVVPNNYILACIMKCCQSNAITRGMIIHHHSIEYGLNSDVIVAASLVNQYAKCGMLQDAYNVFEQTKNRNVVSYGAMISGYAQSGCIIRAFELFHAMQNIENITPNRVIFLCMISACGVVSGLEEGRFIHDLIVRNGIELDLAVGNTLVDMYAKCGSINEAQNVFDNLADRNVVSWGAMITGYAHLNYSSVALRLFRQMEENKIEPNRVIYLSVLKACADAGEVEQSEAIHNQIRAFGLDTDLSIISSLIEMYSKFGDLTKARKIFDDSLHKNAILFSVMLSGYLQHEEDVLALQLFEKIDEFDIVPDTFIFTCILKACGIARLVSEAMLVHCSIVMASLEHDVAIGSSLIDVYSKCCCLEEARKVFDTCPEKNEVSWGAMLSGYNQHGQGILALELFQKMLQVGEKNPDKVRLLCVLKACGSIGASLHGKTIHALIKTNKVDIDVVLGNAIIDMYAKCGNLEDAYLVFNELKERDIISWGAMIAGYAQQGRHEMVKQFIQAMRCEGLSPNDVIYSSILSACSHSGEVEEGYSYFNSMKQDHGVSPSYELTNCMVDLLGRAGMLNEAEKLLQDNLSSLSDSMAWTSLLTACRTYGNLELGRQCYNEVVHLSPNVSSGYVTMSNIFANAHL